MRPAILAQIGRLRPQPRWRTWLWRGAIVLAVYALLGFVAVPLLLKWQLAKQLPVLTKRPATVHQVRCNPFALSLTIRGLEVREPDGAGAFASLEELHVNLQLWASLFRWAIAFDEIRLVRPAGAIVRQPDGRFNIADLTQPQPATNISAEPAALPRLYVQQLQILAGEVSFTDQSRPVPASFHGGPIDIELSGLNTLPNRDGTYEILASTPHRTKFWWRGNLTLNPVRSTGEFKLSNLHLPPYATYLEDFLDARLVHGRLDFGTRYRVDLSSAQPVVELAEGALDLAMVDLRGLGQQPLFQLGRLSVRGLEANLASQQVQVASVTVTGGYSFVERQADGQINWLALLKLRPAVAEAASPTSTTNHPLAGWQAKLGQIQLAGWTFEWRDRQLKETATIRADEIGASAGPILYPLSTAVPVELGLRLNGQGRVSIQGQVEPMGPAARLAVKVEGLGLPPFQPYVGEQVGLAIRQGRLSLAGDLSFDGRTNATRRLGFAGGIGLEQLRTVDTTALEPFVNWEALTVTGIVAELEPTRLAIGEVKLVGLDTTLLVFSNGLSNLQAMFARPESTNAVPAVSSTKVAVAPPSFAVGAVNLENAAIRFVDQSIQPLVRTGLERLQVQVASLSSLTSAPARLNIAGQIDGRAPFAVTGQLKANPAEPFLDLTISLGKGELTALSPYSAKFAGYAISKGRLSLDLKYDINQKLLSAQNKVRVDQLRLGARSNSPEATKLPVKLAVALLQDRQGVIALDVPLSGRIDDPQFRVLPLVGQVFLNVLTKAVTKPFALLGALVGSDQDLGFVRFAPGSAELLPAETNKLAALSRALVERPGLDLEIAGDIDLALDREALARQQLREQLTRRRIAELPPRQRPAAITEFVLEEADYQRLVPVLFVEVVGTNAPVAVASGAPAGAVPVKAPAQNFISGRRRDQDRDAAAPPQVAGPAGPLTLEQMEQQLLEKLPIGPDDYRRLMRARAEVVRDQLAAGGAIAPERLYLVEPAPPAPNHTGQSRVQFVLH